MKPAQEFAEELKNLRETLQSEYEEKLKNVVSEVDELKAQLEKGYAEKREKD